MCAYILYNTYMTTYILCTYKYACLNKFTYIIMQYMHVSVYKHDLYENTNRMFEDPLEETTPIQQADIRHLNVQLLATPATVNVMA